MSPDKQPQAEKDPMKTSTEQSPPVKKRKIESIEQSNPSANELDNPESAPFNWDNSAKIPFDQPSNLPDLDLGSQNNFT
ncbi:hypothetical protein N7456_011142 [Penicillium angulare]|uniref:Uncharacterized protein n=1 Tax=Penicillium angulare TaxID=116970 RepID=A0A9W9JZW7_9EURO|nr:hypothetical protein N7456_011142 [Penicillium angulare]